MWSRKVERPEVNGRERSRTTLSVNPVQESACLRVDRIQLGCHLIQGSMRQELVTKKCHPLATVLLPMLFQPADLSASVEIHARARRSRTNFGWSQHFAPPLQSRLGGIV